MAIPALIRSRVGAIIGVLAAFALVALLIRGGGREHQAGHLYAVPGGEGGIQVEVMNGSGTQGLARVGTRTLRRAGVDVVYFGNADTTYDSTRLIVRRGSREPADELRELLGAGKIEVAPDSTRRVDVTVILGKDWEPPKELHP